MGVFMNISTVSTEYLINYQTDNGSTAFLSMSIDSATVYRE